MRLFIYLTPFVTALCLAQSTSALSQVPAREPFQAPLTVTKARDLSTRETTTPTAAPTVVRLLARPSLAQDSPAQDSFAQGSFAQGSFAQGSFAQGSPSPAKSFPAAANPQWFLVLSVVLTGGAISWGVSRYVHQQKWQRIEFLRQAVNEFEHDPYVHNALKILDFEEYRDYHIPVNSPKDWAERGASGIVSGPISFRVDDTLLCNALANHDQRARRKHKLNYCQDHDLQDPEALRQYQAALRQYQIETALRDWFNKLLNGLEHFGYFLESGMFTAKELQPWLNYWIKLIGEPAYRRPGASKFYDALYSYIHHSGFFGVQKLFEQFGYRILPSPYQDADFINLDLALPGYNTRLALTLAKASYLAYQDKQFVAEVVGRWGTAFLDNRLRTQSETGTSQPLNPRAKPAHHDIIRHNFRYFNNRGRDTQAYLFRTDEFMVLAFRGSQEPRDWLTNLTTKLRDFTIRRDGVTEVSLNKGRVHTGFFLAWAIIEKSVLGQIQRWRRELAQSDQQLPPLYITGHSLGGALATMAAAALVNHDIDIAGVYTFGQPRVGDRTFTKQLTLDTGGKIYRFVNHNDIVPHVPPPFSIWNPFRFYGHVGIAKHFNAKGSLITNYRLGVRLLDRSLGLLKGVLGAGFDLITDHNMEFYISHLDKALKEEKEDEAARLLELGEGGKKG